MQSNTCTSVEYCENSVKARYQIYHERRNSSRSRWCGASSEHETLPDTAASLCKIKQEFGYLLKILLEVKYTTGMHSTRVVWLYQSWRLCDFNVVHDQQLVLHWIFPPHSYVPTKYFYFKNKRDLTEIAKPNLADSYNYFLG